MFLKNMRDDSKEKFLAFAIICAKSNGKIEEEESALLRQYCDEMQIEMPQRTAKYDHIVEAFDDDEAEYKSKIDNIFNSSSTNTVDYKKIYFELISLVYSDGVITPIEQDILDRLKQKMYQGDFEVPIIESCALSIASGLKIVQDIELIHEKTKGE
ncbi:hypothetical protein ACHJH3_00430 [Campylobacter sp. MOP7]|uniref:tellurite resistance TerB family protein n=1 Tax=Campylobacter canis TaxID=3378588 RepID=UPI00387E7748